MYRALIDEYEKGGEKLRKFVAGLTPVELSAAPIPGKWSTHQVVVHLQDAEWALADRMRRVIADENPPLLAWNETKFIARLHYEKQSVGDAVDLIHLTRRQMARVLRALNDADFDRVGQHNEVGPLTLLKLVETANRHLDHHLKFIQEKREKLGKPLKD